VYLLSHHYEALDVSKYFVVEVETHWNEGLKFFKLIEVVNSYQICSKSFVKRREYNGNSRFLALRNETVL